METTDLSAPEQVRVVVDAAKHQPLAMATVVALNLGVALLSGIGVGFIIPIVDFVVADSAGGGSIRAAFVRAYRALSVPLTLETAIGGVALVVLLRYALQYVAAIRQAKLEASYVRHLRVAAFDALLDARPERLDDIGDDTVLNAIVTESRDAGIIPYRLATFLQALFLSIAFGVVALAIAPALAVLTVVFLGGTVVFVRHVFESGYDAGDRLSDANEQVQRNGRRGIAGLREVKQFALRDRFRRTFRQTATDHARAWAKVRANRVGISILQQAIIAVATFILLYVAVAVFALRAAELAAFLFAVFRAAPQVTNVHEQLYEIESKAPHAARVRELTATLDIAEEPSGGDEPVPRPVRTLTVEDVVFSYDDSDADRILDEVTFSVGRGETVALVGRSGAGKSTLASLLARFHRPDAGYIRANGTPIERFDLAEWRGALGLVRQHPYVFDGTVRENLTLVRPDVDESSLRQACSAACVDTFLEALPAGLDTKVGEDAVKLSGGQRQRIAIARTLLTEPAVLVLDEATSELDTETERALLTNVRDLFGEVPMVLISHRQSVVTVADRVLVLADGRIVERGTHVKPLTAGDSHPELYGKPK